MKFLNYLQEEKGTLTLLIGAVIFPYYLVAIYFPQIPYMHYFFILILFLLKILVLSDPSYKEKLTPRVKNTLQKENKKNPSKSMIYKRVEYIIKARNFSLILSGIIILCISIALGRFQ